MKQIISPVPGISAFHRLCPNAERLGKFCPPDAADEALQAAIDERWHDIYLPLIAEPLQEMVELARHGNADVRSRAELSDVAAATRERCVVVLFAHWKGPEILYDDLIQGPKYDVFYDKAARSESALGKWIASELLKREKTSSSLLDVLNEALDEPLAGSVDAIGVVLEHAVTRQAHRREELEELFPDLLCPGNRLELFDGLHNKETVESHIAPDFNGILDLTVCTSSVLADHLAARRRQQLRTVQFPNVVEFIWAAKAVTGALQLRGTGNFEYLEARNLAAEILNDAIRQQERTGK